MATWPMHTHNPLHSAHYRSSSTAKIDKPSDEVRDIADVPTTFKSDTWKQFGFSVSRHEKGEKVTDRQ